MASDLVSVVAAADVVALAAVDHIVDRRELLDLAARDAPRLLDDPGQAAILTIGLVLDFLEHFFGEVERLFALVGRRHVVLQTRFELLCG